MYRRVGEDRETYLKRYAEYRKKYRKMVGDDVFKTYMQKAAKRWRDKHPDDFKATKRRYKDKYPDRVRISKQNAWRKRAGVEGKITLDEWHETLVRYDYRCAYCGIVEAMTMDHVIPISKGGTNWPSNIVPACRSCNSIKQDRDLDEFLKLRNEQRTG